MQEMLRKSVSIMLVMLLLCTGLTAFATTTPDLTQDYVKTYVEQTNSVIAADSLLKTADTHPTDYRLMTTNDVGGNNGSQAQRNTDWSKIADWDGSEKSASLILEKKAGAAFADNSTGIAGTSFVKDAPGSRLWFDTSSLNDGDVLVVSMYAKTKEAGAATNFNMGYFLYENYALNAYTAEHGTKGVAISDQWTRFAGTITLPAGFKEANANASYSIHFGYAGPKNESEVPTIYLSNAYVAKVAATDITNTLTASEVTPGSTVTAKAAVVNQVGTTGGLSGYTYDWYVTDESRTNLINDGSISVTESEEGNATVSVAKNAENGTYYVVAVASNGWVKGAKLEVSGEAVLDLTKDYVKTYVEQTNSVIAADSLLKTADTHPTDYRLMSTNDIGGNNGSQAQSSTDWSKIADWDGSEKSASLILEKKAGAAFADNSTGIAGTLFRKDSPGSRLWFDTSSLNDGDVLVVSMYAKTKEAGAAANFNMGYFLYENYALNAYTAEHGTKGVAVSDQWTRFAGTITLPAGFKEANVNASYSIHFGYAGPKNESEVPTIYLSNAYVAKVAAVDIENKLDKEIVTAGETVTAQAKVLNQIGTTAGLSQEFTWYVTDSTRTNVLTEGDVTVTPGANGAAAVKVADNAKDAVYYIVAVSKDGMVKGQKLTVGAGGAEEEEEPTIPENLKKDFTSDWIPQNSVARNSENLMINVAGQNDAHRLFNGNYAVRTSNAELGIADSVIDFDGSSKWATMTVTPHSKATNDTLVEGMIEGFVFPAKHSYATPRLMLDKERIKGGDVLVTTIYTRTKEEGKTANVAMGLMTASEGYAHNKVAKPMEIGNTWTLYQGSLTVPKEWDTNGALNSGHAYSIYAGHYSPKTLDEMPITYFSNAYVAKAQPVAFEMSYADGSEDVELGASKTVSAKVTNQIGTTDGVSNQFNWIITNEKRTEVVTDIGVTVTEGKNGTATINVAEDAVKGAYYLIAVSEDGILKGMPLNVAYEKEPLTEIELYVSPNGDDDNVGTIEEPLKTLEAARNYIRSAKGDSDIPVTVYLREGIYHQENTFTLNAQDGGTKANPVVYRAYQDEEVVITGSGSYDFEAFAPVTGEMKNKLSGKAKDQVMVADGAALGMDPINVGLKDNNFEVDTPLMMLDHHQMNLSRYPNSNSNDEWIIAEAVNPNSEKNTLPSVKFEDDYVWNWDYRTEDFIYFGYIAYGWTAGGFHGTMDKANKTVNGTDISYYGTTAGKSPIRVFNAYQAIDEPGEWYYDKTENKLYVYPFEDTTKNSKLYLTTGNNDIISITNASYISLEGLTITSSQKYGVNMKGVDHCVINNCVLNNFKSGAISIDDALSSGVKNSVVSQCGVLGIYIDGGDMETLESSGNFISNNIIHDAAVRREFNAPGIRVRGVGTRIDHNEFYNFPNCTINFASAGDQETSVNTVIEYNSFHECNMNGLDMAVIYGGRDLRSLGTVVNNNHFYNISNNNDAYGFCGSAVFGDDYLSEVTITNNIVGPGSSGAHTEAFKINSGHGFEISNNLVIDVPAMFYMYKFANGVEQVYLGAETPGVGSPGGTLAMVWDNEAYQKNWPWVKAYYEGKGYYVPNELSKNVLVYTDNVPRGISGWPQWNNSWYILSRAEYEDEIVGFKTNSIMLKDKTTDNRDLFVDYENGDYRLKDEVLSQVDFKNIDQSDIGPKAFSYDGKELLPGGNRPAVSDIRFSELPKVGRDIEAIYQFKDADGDKEAATSVNFYLADSADEKFYLNWKKMTDHTTTNGFTVTAECEGKWLRAKVTPVDSNGIAGATVWSDPVFVDISGSVEKEALFNLVNEAKEALSKATVGEEEGQWLQSEVDLLSEAIKNAQTILDRTDVTQYMVDQMTESFETSYRRFINNQNVAENANYVVVNPLISEEENWEEYAAAPVFADGTLSITAESLTEFATYVGKKFTNTVFSFQYKQTTNDSWGGIYLAQDDALVYPWQTTGVLICIKEDVVELQFRDGKTECNEEEGTMIIKHGDYFKNGETYDVTLGMYDVNATDVRVVMTVNGEELFNVIKSIPSFVSKEGYFGVIGHNTEVTIGSLEVDKSALKATLKKAEEFADDMVIGTDYNEYTAEVKADLETVIADGQKVYEDEFAASQAVEKADFTLTEAIKAAKAKVNNTKQFTQNGTVALNTNAPISTFDIPDDTEAKLSGADAEKLPAITVNATDFVMEIPAKATLSGKDWDGVLPLPSKIAKPSGTMKNATINGVYSLGTKAITSDEWIKITLKGQKRYVIAYLNDQGSYTPIRPADRSKEADVIYREDNGDDVIVYTKKLVELISYQLNQSTTPTPTPDVSVPNIGNGGGFGGAGFLGGGGNASAESKKAPFTDIIGHWAEDAINNMYDKEIVSGVTATTFEPDRSITRAEFATLIVKALNLTGNSNEHMFKDVESGSWYAKYVNLAAMSGLIVGYDGNFRPNDTITRQEAAVIAVKAYEFLGKETKKTELSFTDKDDISEWAKEYVTKAAGSGIISGMPNGSFVPLDLTTRAQAVAILERIF